MRNLGAYPRKYPGPDTGLPELARYTGMKTLEDQSKHAKILLGDTGELERVAALALVYPAAHGGWVVRAVISLTNCEEITGFVGPTAQQRAMEYAGEKYAGVRVYDAAPT